MFDHITAGEKEDLRARIAEGNSVNNNPYLHYEENGCLTDFITASHTAKEMADRPEMFRWSDLKEGGLLATANDEPF